MPTLTEIREQYPQYSDMSDEALAGALYQKFYSDMPRADFDTKVGFKPTAQAPAKNVAGKPILAPAEAPAEPQAEAPEAPKPPPYKNRLEALDDAVNLLEEGAPKEELIPAFERMGIKWGEIIRHGRQRGSSFFTDTVPVPPRQMPIGRTFGEMKATEPGMLEGTANLFKRVGVNLNDAATGFLVQTGGINPDQAGTVLARNAKRRAAAMPDSSTRAGMEQIGNAKTYGDAVSALAKNPAATFTMLTEAVATSLLTSAPALVLGPAGVATRAAAQFAASGGMEYASVLTDVLQDAKVNLLDANAVAEALKDPDILAKAKEKGAKRGLTVGAFDAITMGLAGRFLRPAQQLIAEGKLAGQAARKATLSAWGKELALQAGGGAGGEFAAQKLTGENKPAEVLMEALAEGLTAPLDVRANLRQAAELEKAAQLKAAPGIDERIEPTFDEEAFLRGEVPKTVQEEEADEVEAITKDLIKQNIPSDSARRIAEKRVLQNRKDKITDLIAEPSDDPVRIRAKEHIDEGMDPVEAINRARLEIQAEQEADASAQAYTEGAPDVGQTITPAGGAGVQMAGQPSAEPTAAGAREPITDGMVSARPDVAVTPEGERREPSTVTGELRDRLEKIANRYEELGDGKKAQAVYALMDSGTTPEQVAELEKQQAEQKITPEQQAKNDFAAVLDQAGEIFRPYPTAKKDAKGRWLSRDGKFTIVPIGGYGWQVVDLPTADFIDAHGFGNAHPNREAIEAFQLARKGKDPAAVREKTIQAFKDVGMYDAEIISAVDEMIKAARKEKQLTPETPSEVPTTAPTETPTEAAVPAPATESVETQAPAGAPAAVKPATKRGRPAAPLTEEQKAEKEKATKGTNAANARVRRRIDRLSAEIAESNLPVDETNIETPEALETAKQEKRAQRIAAVRELFTLAKQQGNSALGNRAKAVLADRKLLSQQEHDLLKTGWQATQSSRQARNAARTAKAHTNLKGTMTAAQVLTQVSKTGNPFQRRLAGLLRKLLTGVNVHIVEEGDPTPPRLQGDPNWERARGVYLSADETGPREVYLRGASAGIDNGVNNITILHELLHAALNRKVWGGLIGKEFAPDAKLTKFVEELTSLMLDAGDAYMQAVATGRVPRDLETIVESTTVFDPDTNETSFEIFELPHEFLSYGLTQPEFQAFLGKLPGKRNGFTRFVQSIMKYLGMSNNDMNALADLISVSEDIANAPIPEFVHPGESAASYARKKKGKAQAQPAQPPVPKATVIPSDIDQYGNPQRSAAELNRDSLIAQETVRASRAAETLSATEQLFKARDEEKVLSVLQNLVKNKWAGMSNKAIKALVIQPTMTFLAKWSGIKAIEDADIQMQRMIGMANSLTAAAYDVRQMLAKELNPFFRSAKKFRTDFENLVYESTINRYDPSDTRNKVRDDRIDKMWSAIGEKGRRMYKALQGHYENLIDLYSDLLDQQIENLQGLDPDAKQNIMSMIRSQFETGARIRPYFPLVRFGDYWLRVSKGDFKGFYMFESVGDRNAYMQQLADEMREDSGDTSIFETGDSVRGLRLKTQQNSDMLKSIFAALDKENFGAEEKAGGDAAREALKDSIYQIYLNTMPEQSFRSMFIHRKDRIGFSPDVLRNVAASAAKMSMQLARLKYAPMLRNSVSAAYDAARNNSNLSPFAEETERRVNLALAGNSDKDFWDTVAGVANKASYFWFLSSAASALIQPASLYITALPVIGANHNDMVGAARELGKMVTLLHQYSAIKRHQDGTWSLSAPSISNSETLNDREKEAVREMFQRGVSQSTYASLVYGYTSLPTRSASTVLGKGKELGAEGANLAVGALMHNVERLTREATYLASYRVGYRNNLKRGMTQEEAHQAAMNQAVNDVNESLANYDITNRPRYMQAGLGRILFQFKMFPLHTALLLTTNFFKMLPFFNKEGKAAAAKKFFGIYLTAGSIAGAFGLPAFSPIVGILAAALKQMEDDDDLPDELKDKDPQTWFREVFLPNLLGDKTFFGVPASELVAKGPLDAMTGLAISGRIGLNDLFGRDTKEAKTAREDVTNWILEHAGPTASLGLSLADAYEAYKLGDYEKAVDRLSPAVIRNIRLAERMAREGVKDSKGNLVMTPDEAKAYALAQAIGFRPAEVARMSEINFKMTAIDQRIQNERDTLIGRMKVQARLGTDESALKLEKIFDTEVARFNKKNPEYALEPDSVVDTLVKDLETRASARLGFVVNEKNARLADPVLYRMEQRLEKLRERK